MKDNLCIAATPTKQNTHRTFHLAQLHQYPLRTGHHRYSEQLGVVYQEQNSETVPLHNTKLMRNSLPVNTLRKKKS